MTSCDTDASCLNEDEYTLSASEKANEKERKKRGEKERWRFSRHLSGQRPAAVRGTSDMKMRAAQPPADLSHRSRRVHPIPHSMKYPSPLPTVLGTFCRLDLLDASLFVSTISPSMFLSVSRLAVSSFHAKPTVFFPLPGSRRHPRDAMSHARGHKTRYCRPIDRYKGSVCTP